MVPPTSGPPIIATAMTRGHHALVLAALPGRYQIADDRHHADHQAARAQSLDGAEADQLPHVLGHAAQHRADQEDHDGGEEGALAAVHVAELAPDRGGGGGGQGVRGDHPGQMLQAAQLADDGRHRGADDHVVEHGQQHGDHEREDHDPHAARLRLLVPAAVASVLVFRYTGHRSHSPTLTCRPAS